MYSHDSVLLKNLLSFSYWATENRQEVQEYNQKNVRKRIMEMEKGKREIEKKFGFPSIDGVCYDVNIRVFQIISAQTGR